MLVTMASISISDPVRDELRRYKAQDGLTYDEAIAQLLSDTEWISDPTEILDSQNHA